MAAMGCMKEFLKKKIVMGIILGQFLSLMITSTGFTSSELARRGVNAPTSQSFANYVLLALIYGALVVLRKMKLQTLLLTVSDYVLQTKWYFYALLGLIDVEANFLVVKAYQYTSLTSVMLLDCWSIPCVIILTRIFLKTKYGWKKLGGVVVCILGVVMVVLSDVHAQDRKDRGSNPVKGDLFVVAGATLYAVSNVSEEFLVKNADRVELMAMLGVLGAIVSAIQISILERRELRSITWSAGAVLPFVGFAVAMFLFYSLVPVLLKMSGSTMLNLSLLTSDMWAVLIRIFAYHEKVDWLYFLAFAAVAVGLIIYSWGDKEEQRARAAAADKERERCQRLDEEGGVRSSNQDILNGSFRREESTSNEQKEEIDNAKSSS